MAYQTKNTRTHSSVPNPDNNPAWPSLKLLGSSTLCFVVIVRNTSQNGIIPAASFVRPYVAHICFVFLLKDLSLTSERPSKLILWSSFRLWAVALQGGRGGGLPLQRRLFTHAHAAGSSNTHSGHSRSTSQTTHYLTHSHSKKGEKTHSLVCASVCLWLRAFIYLSIGST